jgi:hypothetical protein
LSLHYRLLNISIAPLLSGWEPGGLRDPGKGGLGDIVPGGKGEGEISWKVVMIKRYNIPSSNGRIDLSRGKLITDH